jgi:hypothetical protein
MAMLSLIVGIIVALTYVGDTWKSIGSLMKLVSLIWGPLALPFKMKWFQISLLLARFKLLMLFEAVCSINCKGASYMRMLICPHVGPKGTFTCHIVCCEHALEWWNNVSPFCFNVSFHSAMETWMLACWCMYPQPVHTFCWSHIGDCFITTVVPSEALRTTDV